jgi:O-acetylhomoserine (thiol)-lyase
MLEDRPLQFATLAVHAGGTLDDRAAIEQRVALMEGGSAAAAVAPGSPLILTALQPLMRPGDQIVAARQLGAVMRATIATAFPGFGWEARFAEIDDLASFERAISPKTQLLLVASIAPSGEVADIAALAALAKRAGVPLIVDNTLLTPALCRPFDFGADIVVHTDVWFLCGSAKGTGFIVDGGRFNWLATKRYPALSEPRKDRGGGEALAETVGNFAYVAACRAFAGDRAHFNPADAAEGIQTLPLRMARHSENARNVAEFIAGHRRVLAVRYAGLPGDRHHALAKRYCPTGAGASVEFTVEGGDEAAAAVHEHLHLIATGLPTRPALTSLVPAADRDEGASPGTLRLSTGLEDVSDITADLDHALAR